MPDESRRSILVSIFKNKEDIQSYTNYREINLMSHTMKVWERVIEYRLKKIDNCLQKLVWFYSWEVHHGDDFLDKTTHREISGTKE
jgi:hypothetical protein